MNEDKHRENNIHRKKQSRTIGVREVNSTVDRTCTKNSIICQLLQFLSILAHVVEREEETWWSEQLVMGQDKGDGTSDL